MDDPIIYPLPSTTGSPPQDWFAVYGDAFDWNQRKQLIDYLNEEPITTRKTRWKTEGIYVLERAIHPNTFPWFWDMMVSLMLDANVLWNFSLDAGIRELPSVFSYPKGGYTRPHIDFDLTLHHTSKITAIALLQAPKSGGELVLAERFYPEMFPGDVVVFPSFCVHEVRKVTSGVRVSAGAWLNGPRFR